MTDDDRPTCLRSTLGRPWEIVSYHPRSPLAAEVAALLPGETYDDGDGNLYRLEDPAP